MRVVVQRVSYSSVSVDGKLVNEIDNGLNVLVGFTEGDSSKEIDYLVKKVVNLRIFDDENGVMNKSILDTDGEILLISQFTLYASTVKGNRPSYVMALNGEKALPLYEEFHKKLNDIIPTKIGVFGAEMDVKIHNDGPITIIIDSK